MFIVIPNGITNIAEKKQKMYLSWIDNAPTPGTGNVSTPEKGNVSTHRKGNESDFREKERIQRIQKITG